MSLDFSGLDDLSDTPESAAASSAGKILQLALVDVLTDPNQPRKEFDKDSLAELAASIAERGVKYPISVKPHPTETGKYVINAGERRYRASQLAGKTEIPAFIDLEHNDYDQIAENLQREGLTAMEMALFIKRRQAAGEKPSQIAKKLGKGKSFVSEHQALIDAPAEIDAAYRAGRCTSARTLYDLRGLYDKYSAQVVEFLSTHEGEIDRRTVAALSASLKSRPAVVSPPQADPSAAAANFEMVRPDEQQQPDENEASPTLPSHETPLTDPSADTVTSQNVRQDEHPAGETAAGASAGQSAVGEPEGAPNGRSNGSANVTQLLGHNSAHQAALNPKKPPGDPRRIKKPVLIVEHDSRAAMVLIFNRPSSSGLIWIKYDDNGEEAEVVAVDCLINHLTDSV